LTDDDAFFSWTSTEGSGWTIAESVEALEDLPPLVVEDCEGGLVVCDGTHRLEAVRRKGWPTCWAILFSDG